MPDGKGREPQARAHAAVRSARGLERVGWRHRPEHLPGVGERLAQVRHEFGLRRGWMRPAGAASHGRRLLLDLVKKRKVTARHVLDLLAERPNVTKRTAGRLESILLRRHRIGEGDEGLLDHHEPLPDGYGHRVDAFLAEYANWECQTRSENEHRSEALTRLLPLKQ